MNQKNSKCISPQQALLDAIHQVDNNFDGRALSPTELAHKGFHIHKTMTSQLPIKSNSLTQTEFQNLKDNLKNLDRNVRNFNDYISPGKAESGEIRFTQGKINSMHQDGQTVMEKAQNFSHKDQCLGVLKKGDVYCCGNNRGLTEHVLANQQVHRPRIINSHNNGDYIGKKVGFDKNSSNMMEDVSLEDTRTKYVSVGGHQTIDPPPMVHENIFQRQAHRSSGNHN
jgi:hypothetical protein